MRLDQQSIRKELNGEIFLGIFFMYFNLIKLVLSKSYNNIIQIRDVPLS